MSIIINGATCSDDFDIVLTDAGFLSVETETKSSIANMLKLDFNSNNNWELDAALGLPWITRDNDGLLQRKSGEKDIVMAIQRKLTAMEGVKSVDEIEVSRGVNRSLYFKVVITTSDGKSIEISKEVK